MLSLLKHNCLSDDMSIECFESPYRYYVINNLFNAETYEQLCNDFHRRIHGVPRYCDLPNPVSTYTGIIKGVAEKQLTRGYDFFASDTWKEFNSKYFGLPLTNYMSINDHFHKAPGQVGHSHTDFAVCHFKRHQYIDSNDYCTDYDHQKPDSVYYARSIAMLYYFNNSPQFEGDGGTDVLDNFESFNGKVIRTVPATNNSVFVFEITRKSYHRFAGSTFDRHAMVSWFHSSPAFMLHRNLEDTKNYYKTFNQVFDRWNREVPAWKINLDPEFKSVFGDKSKEVEEYFGWTS